MNRRTSSLSLSPPCDFVSVRPHYSPGQRNEELGPSSSDAGLRYDDKKASVLNAYGDCILTEIMALRELEFSLNLSKKLGTSLQSIIGNTLRFEAQKK